MLTFNGVNNLTGSKNLADSCSTDRLVTGHPGLSHLSLPLVSKVLECCVYNRVVDHIAPQLHKLQFGFLKGKSTTAQLLFKS